jgi:3-oxoadipate enol-lactonase
MPTAQVNGITTYYEVHGSGEPLLFSHSFTSDSSMWTMQVPAFRQRYQFITYDIRGQGKSDSPPGEYSIDLFTEDLYQLVRHLGLQKFILGGLSIGGMIACHFALAHQDMLQALILADTAAAPPDVPLIKEPAPFIHLAETQGMEALADHVINNKLLAPHLQDNPYAVKEYRDRLLRHNVTGYVNGVRALSRMRDRTTELSAIRVPTLIIVGEWDAPFLRPAEVLQQQIPNAKLVTIPRAGHLTNIEQPQLFNAAVLEFLEKI